MQSYASSRSTMIVFLIVIVAVIGGSLVLWASRPAPVQITIQPPIPTATPLPTATPAPMVVYVTGAVQNPQQQISLPLGSRVQDALDAVGGLLETADLDRINPAALLQDGAQVHVPARGETARDLPTPSGSQHLNLNRATAEELVTLPGIGPALAARIVEYREANGPFPNVEALDNVSGVGPAILNQISALVTVE